MKIVADQHIPFLQGNAEHFGEVVYLPGKHISAQHVSDADALIVRTVTSVNEELLKNSKVKIVCSATIGFDHIDTAYCKANSIHWTNAPGCNSGSVQQYITSALIALSRRQKFRLQDVTIGIVGVGNVGSKVVKACKLLGMNILQCDPPRAEREGEDNFVSLSTIAEQADIITFHTPLTRNGKYATFHLADDTFFRSLKRKPLIINSARGAIVDTQALKTALREKIISGCVIDCWEGEPNIDLELLQLADLATPHIAGYSADGKANATRMSLEALCSYFKLPKDKLADIQAPNVVPNIIQADTQTEQDRIHEALLRTYNIENESEALKQSPDKFAHFREHYPLRRENSAYLVAGFSPEEQILLKKWGFNTADQ